jgi:hypothetical protein
MGRLIDFEVVSRSLMFDAIHRIRRNKKRIIPAACVVWTKSGTKREEETAITGDDNVPKSGMTSYRGFNVIWKRRPPPRTVGQLSGAAQEITVLARRISGHDGVETWFNITGSRNR